MFRRSNEILALPPTDPQVNRQTQLTSQSASSRLMPALKASGAKLTGLGYKKSDFAKLGVGAATRLREYGEAFHGDLRME
jgi:hypothetical protein